MPVSNRRIALALLAAALGLAPTASAASDRTVTADGAEATTPAEVDCAAFAIEGVRVGMSVREVSDAYPGLFLHGRRPPDGYVGWGYDMGWGPVDDGVYLNFLVVDGYLMQVSNAGHGSPRTSPRAEDLLSTFITNLGPPTTDSATDGASAITRTLTWVSQSCDLVTTVLAVRDPDPGVGWKVARSAIVRKSWIETNPQEARRPREASVVRKVQGRSEPGPPGSVPPPSRP